MKKKFKDIQNSEYFGCWGDMHSNHTNPAWIVCVKKESGYATEVNELGLEGVTFPIGDNEDVQYYGGWTNADFRGNEQ